MNEREEFSNIKENQQTILTGSNIPSLNYPVSPTWNPNDEIYINQSFYPASIFNNFGIPYQVMWGVPLWEH